MLGIDEGGAAAGLLCLRYDLEGERGFPGGFRAVDLDDPTAGQASDAERHIELQGSGGNDIDIAHHARVTHAHDGAFTELSLNLR